MKKYVLGIAVFMCLLAGGCNDTLKEDSLMSEAGNPILEKEMVQLGAHINDAKGRINEINADIVRLKKEAYIRGKRKCK